MTDSATPNIVMQRALYYPYIHIRDVNWLKSTLLSFRQVRRMVPDDYPVQDMALVKPFLDLEGPDGPLLTSANVRSGAAQSALHRLSQKIGENLDFLKERYSEEKTPEKWKAGKQAFEIHRDKLSLELVEQHLLPPHGLAWFSRDQSRPSWNKWLTVHPTIGSAIMSTLALSVGTAEGLGIVTADANTHETLLANSEADVFNALLGIDKPELHQGPKVEVTELVQVVITTGFDLTRLTAENIKDLLNEGKDLGTFVAKASTLSEQIPVGLDKHEREKRLKQAAQSLLDEWHDYHALLPDFAKDAMIEKAIEKLPEKAVELFPVATGATVTGTLLGALPGLSVALFTAAGLSMYKERHGPFRFLNRLEATVDKSIGSIYVPQWRQLAS